MKYSDIPHCINLRCATQWLDTCICSGTVTTVSLVNSHRATELCLWWEYLRSPVLAIPLQWHIRRKQNHHLKEIRHNQVTAMWFNIAKIRMNGWENVQSFTSSYLKLHKPPNLPMWPRHTSIIKPNAKMDTAQSFVASSPVSPSTTQLPRILLLIKYPKFRGNTQILK